MSYEIASMTYSAAEPEIKPSREMVLALEETLKTLPQSEAPVTHHFCDGIYAREMFIPKGTILTGKIHRFAHINIISQGDITVLTEHGMKRLKAPCTIISQPGIKRAGYAHEDTVWTTIHPTPETDLEKIEEHFIARDFSEFPQVAADQVSLP